MNILYISYWGINEGLTVATVDPHLEVLSNFGHVKKIVLTTIERENNQTRKLTIDKVRHIPIDSGKSLLDKFKDYSYIPNILVNVCSEYSIDTIICRGAPAGALGYLVWEKTNIPFYVESFEPHADYMLESSVWKKWDLRYLLSRYWEMKQKKYAKGLLTVSHNYKKKLINEGVLEDKIKVLPCTVDIEKFSFNLLKRDAIRKKLGISDPTIVGIYVGKYGGIYMDDLAFKMYQQAFQYFKNFFLIILSPKQHHSHICEKIKLFKLPQDNIYIREVPHHTIPDYLSASDFGYATIKPSLSRLYCSAIKIGEYWANGLPIVIPPGIGDDSSKVSQYQAGIIIDAKDVDYKRLNYLVHFNRERNRISRLASKYRNRNLIETSYKDILKGANDT